MTQLSNLVVAKVKEVVQTLQPISVSEILESISSSKEETRLAIEHLVQCGEIFFDVQMKLQLSEPTIISVCTSKECMNKEQEEMLEILNSSDINGLCELMYNEAKEKGFHSKEEVPNLANYMMNLHSEISELWESYRKNQVNNYCDKSTKMSELGLEKLTCFEEELADIFIRTCDTAGAFKINLAKAVFTKMMFNRSRPHRNGGKIA